MVRSVSASVGIKTKISLAKWLSSLSLSLQNNAKGQHCRLMARPTGNESGTQRRPPSSSQPLFQPAGGSSSSPSRSRTTATTSIRIAGAASGFNAQVSPMFASKRPAAAANNMASTSRVTLDTPRRDIPRQQPSSGQRCTVVLMLS